ARREDGAAEHAALPVNMLGAGINDDIGAIIERFLQDRRGKDVVDDNRGADLSPKVADCRKIYDLKRWIGGSLKENALGLGGDRFLPRLHVLAVDERRVDAKARQDAGDDLVAGA